MSAWITGQRGYLVVCVLALCAVVGTYANHFRNEFHFDDVHTIENNSYIRDLGNIPSFFTSARTFSAIPSHQSYRPLVTTTLAVDYRLAGGLKPIVFHATSFALFITQCIAMLFLLRRLLDWAQPHQRNKWVALFAVSWYALHTANAETVNYIIARSEILSTLGTIFALLLFARGGKARSWALYLIPAAAAVLAKEQGAMAAALLFVYAGLFEYEFSIGQLLRPRQIAAVLRTTWLALAVCGGLATMSIKLAESFIPGGPSRVSYLMTQPFVIMHYALTFLLPFNLSADTDWKIITSPFDDRVLVGVIFIASALWTAVVTSRKRETRPIAFGILWFFLALLPTSSVVPLAEVMNDHRMYFPFVGAVIVAASLMSIVWSRHETLFTTKTWMKPAAILGCMAILTAHAFGTYQRNRVWHTDESLWLDVIQKSPENGRGLMNYGLIQMERGNRNAAEYYFNRALQYSPYYAYLHINMGVLKGALGKTAEAEHHFQLAQLYEPTNPVSYFYYARWLRSAGRDTEALTTVQRAVELSPSDVQSQNLMRDIMKERQSDAREAAPEHWLDVSLVQFRNGDYQGSLESSRRALQLRPEYAAAYNNLCAAENAMGLYSEAAADCKRALALQPEYPLARNNLAYALSKGKSSSD